MDIQNQYEFRPLRVEDHAQLLKLTGDAYYPDTELSKAFGYTYEEQCDMARFLDFPYFVNNGVNYGAFYEGKLVSCVLSADVLDFGPKQEVSQKTANMSAVCWWTIEDFLKEHNFKLGECVRIVLLQTHPDHRQKKLAKTVLTLCHQKWKELKFKWAVLEAVHIATQKSFFSLSKKQHILKTNYEFEGKPCWTQGEAIEIEY
ncbi:hypothetical protein pb186bvf_001844 [Paramecium bursaria]